MWAKRQYSAYITCCISSFLLCISLFITLFVFTNINLHTPIFNIEKFNNSSNLGFNEYDATVLLYYKESVYKELCTNCNISRKDIDINCVDQEKGQEQIVFPCNNTAFIDKLVKKSEKYDSTKNIVKAIIVFVSILLFILTMISCKIAGLADRSNNYSSFYIKTYHV